MAKSFRALVLETVLRLGECTNNQVVAVVGKHISAASAVVAGRRKDACRVRRSIRLGYIPHSAKVSLLQLGKEHLVGENLRRLARQGKIRRVSLGVYAPPLPKIYNSETA